MEVVPLEKIRELFTGQDLSEELGLSQTHFNLWSD
jgi:hypothetical protein